MSSSRPPTATTRPHSAPRAKHLRTAFEQSCQTRSQSSPPALAARCAISAFRQTRRRRQDRRRQSQGGGCASPRRRASAMRVPMQPLDTTQLMRPSCFLRGPPSRPRAASAAARRLISAHARPIPWCKSHWSPTAAWVIRQTRATSAHAIRWAFRGYREARSSRAATCGMAARGQTLAVPLRGWGLRALAPHPRRRQAPR